LIGGHADIYFAATCIDVHGIQEAEEGKAVI